MMNLVHTYTPPTDDFNSAVTALQFLYPIDNGQHVDYSQDSQMSALFTDLEEARAHADGYKALEEQYKQKTQQSMGEQYLNLVQGLGNTALCSIANAYSESNLNSLISSASLIQAVDVSGSVRSRLYSALALHLLSPA